MKYLKNGGDEKNIITIKDEYSLLHKGPNFQPLKKFKYKRKTIQHMGLKWILDENCDLNVSSFEVKHGKNDPAKNLNHHLVAKGDKAYSAGILFIFSEEDTIKNIYLSNRSSRFCPTRKSLDTAKKKLIQLGVDTDKIKLINKPNPLCYFK